ncbi:MAG: MFS transporter [Pirellulales bacterium]
MERPLSMAERVELMTLLFLHGMALGSWFVPLSSVLDDAHLSSLKPWAFAASALAAMLSPLFFGAMADRSVPPSKVLRWISIGTAISASASAWSIQTGCSLLVIWVLIQIQSIFCSPSSSLTGSIVFSRLAGSQKQFGSIRALGTIGWMAGCWTTSLLQLDASPNSFYVSALLWIALATFTLIVPADEPTAAENSHHLSLKERFGFDALSLLRNHDHRVVFLTAAFVAIPFAAFYPYTPPLLRDLGLESISAWMSLGQVSEVFALIGISAILYRFKMKWVVLAGIGFGVARYLLYASGITWAVLIGLSMHGVAFTFTYISTQIYLAEKIDAAWRTRAQALLSFMVGGVGNFAGYLLTGSWMSLCGGKADANWTVFWLGLASLVVAVFAFFGLGYRGERNEAK